MQQTAQNPMGAKNTKKKTRTLTHRFFSKKNTGSNVAMLVRAVTQQTHRPQKRNKNTDFDPLFFRKNNGSNVAMLVRAATLQTHRPQKRNKNTDFDPLFFFDKKGYMCPASTHHLPTASAAPTPHISPQQTHLPPTYLKVTSTHPSRAREDSSPRPQSTVAELPSGTTKG